MKRSVWLALALLVGACKSGASDADEIVMDAPPRKSAPATGAAQPAAQPLGTAAAPVAAAPVAAPERGASPLPSRPKTNPVHFQGALDWKSWDEGAKLAQGANKPIFLLVYADWCPHCRELGPVFADPEIEKLSKQMVMVRQDADDDAAWLTSRVGTLGSYVPRIFFLSPDGKVRSEINSGNARYPYFYTPEGIEALKASMRRATSAT